MRGFHGAQVFEDFGETVGTTLAFEEEEGFGVFDELRFRVFFEVAYDAGFGAFGFCRGG